MDEKADNCALACKLPFTKPSKIISHHRYHFEGSSKPTLCFRFECEDQLVDFATMLEYRVWATVREFPQDQYLIRFHPCHASLEEAEMFGLKPAHIIRYLKEHEHPDLYWNMTLVGRGVWDKWERMDPHEKYHIKTTYDLDFAYFAKLLAL